MVAEKPYEKVIFKEIPNPVDVREYEKMTTDPNKEGKIGLTGGWSKCRKFNEKRQQTLSNLGQKISTKVGKSQYKMQIKVVLPEAHINTNKSKNRRMYHYIL